MLLNRLDIIKSFKFKLDRNTLEQFYLYNTFVLQILEHGDIMWSGACDRDLDKLDKSPCQSYMRLITGAIERSHTHILYEDRRWHKILKIKYI